MARYKGMGAMPPRTKQIFAALHTAIFDTPTMGQLRYLPLSTLMGAAMSSQTVSSRIVSATAGARGSSLKATISRLARLMWRSNERHSLYQVMLAAGHQDASTDAPVHDSLQTGQH
ncbi:hypothetical protein [Paraburkholderia sp. BCC1885]|uniref:hypothetical protein n=1 Tax=Paraburkholderia sp. BCC1885 TaxID=2562669 RepID=UPI0011822CF8|nr:hypothetical protein [Paraburkholderia sp. BCC1885]